MKGPHQFSAAHVPGPHVARGSMRRVFLGCATRYHKVLVNDRGRRQSIAARQPVHDGLSIEINNAVVAESRVRFPGLRVQRI